jgi:hypothetical protein
LPSYESSKCRLFKVFQNDRYPPDNNIITAVNENAEQKIFLEKRAADAILDLPENYGYK